MEFLIEFFYSEIESVKKNQVCKTMIHKTSDLPRQGYFPSRKEPVKDLLLVLLSLP